MRLIMNEGNESYNISALAFEASTGRYMFADLAYAHGDDRRNGATVDIAVQTIDALGARGWVLPATETEYDAFFDWRDDSPADHGGEHTYRF